MKSFSSVFSSWNTNTLAARMTKYDPRKELDVNIVINLILGSSLKCCSR